MSDNMKVTLEGSRPEIIERMRQEVRTFDGNRLASWRWWSGFLWGVFFMAVMNIGDVHICAGECDGEGLTLMEAFE